jgi:PAS domain S-box-containing protein
VLCFTALFPCFAGTHPGHALANPPDAIVAAQLTLIAMSLPLIFVSALLTERQRTEEELRTGHTRYGLATSAGSVGVWDCDLKTNEMYFDPALKRFLGYEDHEISNHLDDWARLVHPEDRERVFAEVQAHTSGRSAVFEMQHRMLHKDGSVRWFLCRGVVVERDEERATRMIGTDTDITLQKRAEQALEESQAKLARLTRLSDMGGLAATLAHEINQPLCAIVANAAAAQRLLVRSDPDLAQVRAALEDVASDGKRASELIRRTRTLFEHGELVKQPLDVNDVVRHALSLTRGTTLAGQVTIRTELGAVPLVVAVPLQLQQVFCNLIVNASEAMTRALDSTQPTLTITTERDQGGGVYATVADNGDGFGGEDPERAFLPLVTTEAARYGHRAGDEPHHRRSPWRSALGDAERRCRRDVSPRLA